MRTIAVAVVYAAVMEADVQILIDPTLLATDSDGPRGQIAVSINPTEQDVTWSTPPQPNPSSPR